MRSGIRRLPDGRKRWRLATSTSTASAISSSPCEQASNGKRGIVWLRFRDSPFQADWDVFDVSGPEGIKFDLNLLLDVDADGDLDVINSEENDNARDGKAGLGVVWYENPTDVSADPALASSSSQLSATQLPATSYPYLPPTTYHLPPIF